MPDTIPPSEIEKEPTDSNTVVDDDVTATTTKTVKPKTPSKPGPKNVDWVAAQKFYLENPKSSYADVAKQFDVSENMVQQRASKESWVRLRKDLGEQTISLVAENIVTQNAEINQRHQGMAQSMQRLIYEKLLIANRQIDKAKKAATNNGGDIDDLTVYDQGMITESKIKSLSEAMVLAINLERVTVNLPTTVERKEITGRNGKDLFGNGDSSKLIELVADTIVALEADATPADSGAST